MVICEFVKLVDCLQFIINYGDFRCDHAEYFFDIVSLMFIIETQKVSFLSLSLLLR